MGKSISLLAGASTLRATLAFSACAPACAPAPAPAQAFVEYPGHPATYGDHTIAASSWAGGPTTVTVRFFADGTLHDDGMGSSQRTARNTLNYTPPYSASATNPQNYDELITLSLYGGRLPFPQQMSASGASMPSYTLTNPVHEALDLLVTDLDQSDAVDDTNYNRSISVLRSPAGVALERIEITFSGTRNSPDRDSGGNASRVYLALATAAPEPGLGVGLVCGIALTAVLVPRRNRSTSRIRLLWASSNSVYVPEPRLRSCSGLVLPR